MTWYNIWSSTPLLIYRLYMIILCVSLDRYSTLPRKTQSIDKRWDLFADFKNTHVSYDSDRNGPF